MQHYPGFGDHVVQNAWPPGGAVGPATASLLSIPSILEMYTAFLVCTVKPGNDPQNTTGPVTKYFLIDPHTIHSNILQSVSRPHLYTCTRNTWIP